MALDDALIGESVSNSVHPKNKLNDLTAPEWISRTVSVFVQKGLGKGSSDAAIERQHPAPFSYQDITKFIEFFTKRGETVLDPFSGVASSLKAAALLGRKSVGIELSQRFYELGHERMRTEVPAENLKEAGYTLLQGDVRTRMADIPDGSIDFMVTSPPYWGILNKVDHKARQERLDQGLTHNYGSEDDDLAHIESYAEFLGELATIFERLAAKVAIGRYCVVIVGDFRSKDRYHMFHSDLASAMEQRGAWKLKGCSIIYQKFKRVFPYGYPYSYVPNIHHQYALIFQRGQSGA